MKTPANLKPWNLGAVAMLRLCGVPGGVRGAQAQSSEGPLQTSVARPVRYRLKAEKARALSECALNGEAREVLLNDVRLWNRMAEYEEAESNPIRDSWPTCR